MILETKHSHRIFITNQEKFPDPKANDYLKTIQEYLGLNVKKLKIFQIFTIKKELSNEQVNAIASGPLIDSILQTSTTNDEWDIDYQWSVEVFFKAGLTDNTGKTAQLTIEDFLGSPFTPQEKVYSSTKYLIQGSLSRTDVETIAQSLFANNLIENILINQYQQNNVEEVNLNVSDLELEHISNTKQLALNLREMQAIQEYFSNPKVIEQRKIVNLTENPTDVEIEVLAQTWSEHCKHKIFNAKIHYKNDSKTLIIDSLFKTYIKAATDKISQKVDWLVSVFTDNAGIIKYSNTHNIAFKVETHNSPSALDPYGGALTGILGVNRDIMGAGMGARLLANTDVFCFAPLDYNKPLPKRLLHPQRIFDGVRLGVEHGGNKSGVPTINGSVVFDERYLGKPLVYCGSVGIIPSKIQGVPSEIKEIIPGDLIVVAGGRTGKDGIHGATFSSEELNENSPTGAVQIGDPFTQKKLHDFLLEARDQGLYRTVTDNGAGGFSSSVGELAELCNGCEIHLDQAPLKYEGLTPWEILVSESQERMTFAVDRSKWDELQTLGALHEVEIASIGTFTDSGYFHALYKEKSVAYLSLSFLHHGLPQLELEAEWKTVNPLPKKLPESDFKNDLHALLSRPNICSKESMIRQYDHEVQGGSVLKPLVGVDEDGPGDAAIIRPIEGEKGIVISHGICPRYSDYDTYDMAANAIDEAIRNAVSVGCDPLKIAILDNFCWPDPIYHSEKTPDGKFKLAQLVRANQALYDYAVSFSTPLISGKDSMKNDYKIGNTKISVPPTLLISAIGIIDEIQTAVSMDVKCEGDLIYVVGITKNEWGGSEYALMKGLSGGIVPKVDSLSALKTYQALHEAMKKGLIASCHDSSDGGLAVSLAESAFSGGFGLDVDLNLVPCEGSLNTIELLFSESASRFVVSVNPLLSDQFEQVMKTTQFAKIGKVNETKMLFNEDINAFKSSWQKPMEEC